MSDFSILIIDDDERLRDLLHTYISDHDYLVSTAENANAAKKILKDQRFDLIIMDITMPGQDGLSLTDEIRNKFHNDVPILLLTARGNTEDRITGLEKGADDYLAKPFDPKELLLRIKSILKRQNQTKAPHTNLFLKKGLWQFSPGQQKLLIDQIEIPLTQTESKFLHILWEKNGEPVSRDLLSNAFQTDYFSRSFDILVTRLRKKIGDDPKHPNYLKTIRNKGYLLLVPTL